MSYLGLLSLRDGELVVDPEPRVEPDLGGHADLQVDVGANLLKVLSVSHDARPVAVVIPTVVVQGSYGRSKIFWNGLVGLI